MKNIVKVTNWFSLLGAILATTFLHAQSSRPVFEHLTTEHGLSSNKTEAIIQDDDGFYWIATQNGLNRFDGTHIRVYTHDPADTTSLTHNNCTAIVKDRSGDIWIATHHGVSRYSKKTGHFQRIYLHHPTRNDELANRVYHLAVDSIGNVWIAGNGLWQYNTKNNTIQLFQSNQRIPNEKQVYTVIGHLQYDLLRHGLWMSTGNGVIFFDITSFQFYNSSNNPNGWTLFDRSRHNEFTLDHANRIWFRDQQSQCIASFDIPKNEVIVTPIKITTGIRQLQADEKNRIWIFYWVERAVIFDPSTMTRDSTFFMPSNERSALSEQGTSLYIDQQHHYWIASGIGISIYREANQFYHLHQLRPVLQKGRNESVRIQALAQSDPNYLWVGTSDGLYTYHLQTGETNHVPLGNAAPGVTTLLVADGKLWVGAHDLLSSVEISSHEVMDRVVLQLGIIFIRRDDHDHLWVGLWQHGLFQLNNNGLVLQHYLADKDSRSGIASNNLITALPEGDHLWIGYNGGLGYSGFEPSTETWTHFHPHDDKDNIQMLSNAGTVTVITKGNNGHLWLGTHGGGVFYANPVVHTYESLSQASGLKSNYINSILPDRAGHYWIATADGINVMDSATHAIRSLDLNLAFSDNDFRDNGLIGLTGKLYFFFNDQVIEIDPELYDVISTPQRMVISSFSVFDHERKLSEPNEVIRLSHNENFFSLGFSAVKTHPGQIVRYAYRISGFDKDWNYTENPFANYTNVPFGNYTFQVRAANEEGDFGEPLINLPLRISPPFWLTWWFIALTGIAFSLVIYMIYRYRIEQIRKVMDMRAKISRDLHDEVGSALSSIHVYSSVAEKSIEKNPDATRDALRLIHDNSKQVMENMGDIVWAINSHDNGGLSFEKKIKNYGFELLTPLDIVTHYRISPDIEQNLLHMEARKNVLLIAKEAMNNIARYSKATEAAIHLQLVNHHLELIIQDNGIGFDTIAGKAGHGLTNMKKRTEALGGTFAIASAIKKGTTITCTIPFTSIREY